MNNIKYFISQFTKDIILRIFEMYLEGKNYQTIANILNKEKVLYPEKKHWIDSTIDRTINNKIYMDDYERYKYDEMYKEQLNDLIKIVPEFKIANAVVHFDEMSPHMHLVGVPIKDYYKRGMRKQSTKLKIFTKESLKLIQSNYYK